MHEVSREKMLQIHSEVLVENSHLREDLARLYYMVREKHLCGSDMLLGYIIALFDKYQIDYDCFAEVFYHDFNN